MADLTEQILSDDYFDFILPYNRPSVLEEYRQFGAQYLDPHYMLVHSESRYHPFILPDSGQTFNYYPFVPKLFTTLSLSLIHI